MKYNFWNLNQIQLMGLGLLTYHGDIVPKVLSLTKQDLRTEHSFYCLLS